MNPSQSFYSTRSTPSLIGNIAAVGVLSDKTRPYRIKFIKGALDKYNISTLYNLSPDLIQKGCDKYFLRCSQGLLDFSKKKLLAHAHAYNLVYMHMMSTHEIGLHAQNLCCAPGSGGGDPPRYPR